jgi:ATP-dependent RNA helicase DDX52/ROK1
MDILKSLMRGGSLGKGPNFSKSQNASNLPSSGPATNPQLFGHDEDVPVSAATESPRISRKRKRGNLATNGTPTSLPAELDFFGGGNVKYTKSDKEEVDENAEKSKRPKDGGAEDPAWKVVVPIMPEEERRRILQEHKLKIMVIATKRDKPSKGSKPGKAKSDEQKKAKERLFPEPLTSFDELRSKYAISRRLAENLREQGYKLPTEVQLGSLPLLLHRRGTGNEEANDDEDIDLLTVAPTGSGKTLAFLIPLLDRLLRERHLHKDNIESQKEGIKAIIVAPTKELAAQIQNEARKLAVGTGIRVTVMRKGMRVTEQPVEQEQELESADEDDSAEDEEIEGQDVKKPKPGGLPVKADIIVATPLVLLNALNGGSLSLPSVTTLVLDEADVLLDPLFRDQTVGIWDSLTSPFLRVSLWSATMGSSIESLAQSQIYARRKKLSLPKKEGRASLVRLVVGLKDSAVPSISHRLIYAATEQGKLLAIRQLLHPTSSSGDKNEITLRPPFLVFTQTIPRAIALHSELLYDIPISAGGSSRLAVLHSDLSDIARATVMARVRSGEVWVLITTDLLSRGVDFRGINGVVNYDVPGSGASYIHRVGRTGRAGREGGVAVTLYTREDIPYMKGIANIIAASEKQGNKVEGGHVMASWLLASLPNVSKNDKKNLKQGGVEARRGKDGGKAKGRISTKSGFQRKLEGNRKAAVEGSKRRKIEELELEAEQGAKPSDGEWEGLSD